VTPEASFFFPSPTWQVGAKEQNKWKSVEALDSQIRALDLEGASAESTLGESTLGEDDVEPKVHSYYLLY
jgi:hypothetical protein